MTSAKWFHALYLGISIGFAFFWATNPFLSQFNLQLTGALVLLYFISLKFKLTSISPNNSTYLSTTILTVLCLILIFTTGSLTSPLFFILIFLLFAFSLIYEPVQALTATTTLVVIFVFQNYQNLDLTKTVNLSLLIFTTPLAVIFGNIYLKNLQSAGKITILKKAIIDQETDSLLWISSTKPTISTIINSVSDLVIYSNSVSSQAVTLPREFIEKLKVVQKDLITLYSSTTNLEKSIEDTSDNLKL